MLTAAEIAGMQQTVSAALPDVGTVTRDAAGGTLDPITGEWTPASPTTVYNGPCRLRPPDAEDIEVLFGDTQVTKQRFVGTFPHNAAAFKVGDVLTVTASSDPHIAHRTFRVTGHSAGSWHLGRRVAFETVED